MVAERRALRLVSGGSLSWCAQVVLRPPQAAATFSLILNCVQVADGRIATIAWSAIEEELQCSICKQLPQNPVTLKVVRSLQSRALGCVSHSLARVCTFVSNYLMPSRPPLVDVQCSRACVEC